MLGFLVSIVLYLVSLPLKALKLSLDVLDRSFNIAVDAGLKVRDTELKIESIRNRLSVSEEEGKLGVLKKLLSRLIGVLRLSSVVFGVLSFVFGAITLVVSVVLVVSVASSISLFTTDRGTSFLSNVGNIGYRYMSVRDDTSDLNNTDGYNSTTSTGNSNIGINTNTNINTNYSPVVSIPSYSGGTNRDIWVSSCEEMWRFYCTNIDTYWGNSNKAVRKWYNCPILGGVVADDCSGFVSACIANAGFDIGAWSPNYSSWVSRNYAKYDNELARYFNFYTPEDYFSGIYKPQVGDILAYSGHVEIIGRLDVGNYGSWSWGSVPSLEVRQSAVARYRTSSLDVLVTKMWGSNKNRVTGIWQIK